MNKDLEDSELNEKIELYEKEQRRDRKLIIVLIIIIVILIILVCFRMGRIGFIGNLPDSIIDIIPDTIIENVFPEEFQTNNKNNSNNKIEETIQNQASSSEDFSNGIIEIFEIKDNKMEAIEDVTLDIFNNKDYNGQKIIDPGSEGKYYFGIKNLTPYNVIYDIGFLDEMTNPINMKYKLKLDNVYIRGNEEYIGIEDLNVDNVIVTPNSINIFTLEWYWEDDDENDTYVGTQEEQQTYKLTLDIKAELYR